ATRFLRFTPRRIAIAAAALALAGCALWFAPGSERWTKNLFKVDESNSLRVNIMKAFPRMLHDAPEGWGAGNSGAAYVTWYRPDGEMRLVRALVSTHFTWLAEAGWPGRFAYIAGWLVWLAAAARLFRRGGGWFRTAALPLAAATLVAMAFNHAGEEWTLWAVPAAAMAAAVAGRRGREVLFNGRFRRNAAWCCAIVALAAGTCAALYLAGRPGPGEPQILKDGPLVRVCGAATARVPREKRKTVCIAMDEAATGGWMFAGKELLDYCLGAEDAPEAVLTDESLVGLPEEAERLVLIGRACSEYLRRAKAGEPVAKARALVFLSPACDIAEIPERLAQSEGFRAVAGSLAVARMKDAAETRPWLRIVKGAELYIPGWHRIALAR
ncbi:MAG: hypothetical protein IIT98_06810, partial [Kiritimatiellae bacterium]|nr:hypothetical protein [Kiritimatiellia bacterium]